MTFPSSRASLTTFPDPNTLTDQRHESGLGMIDSLTVLERDGFKILFANYANLDEGSIVGSHPSMTERAIRDGIRLFLYDISNTHTTRAIRASSAETLKAIEASNGKTYHAFYGLRGVQKVIANAIAKDSFFAKNMEEGLDFLLKQAKHL